jgi:hypothetical protein
MSKAIRRARSLPPYLLVCVLAVNMVTSGANSKMCGEILLSDRYVEVQFSKWCAAQHRRFAPP